MLAGKLLLMFIKGLPLHMQKQSLEDFWSSVRKKIQLKLIVALSEDFVLEESQDFSGFLQMFLPVEPALNKNCRVANWSVYPCFRTLFCK
jgi:hypothetical protein